MLSDQHSDSLVVPGLYQHVDQQQDDNRLELQEDLDILHVPHQVQLLLQMALPLYWVGYAKSCANVKQLLKKMRIVH